MTSITSDLVKKTARLARIQLSDEETKIFSEQLSPVLDHINNLNQLNTDNVIPTYQVINLKNITREDQVIPSLSPLEAIGTAPKSSQNYIVMPKTIDK